MEQERHNGLRGFWEREGTRLLLGVIGFLGAIAWNGLKDDVTAVKLTQVQQQLSLQKIDGTLSEGIVRDVKYVRDTNERQDKDIKEIDDRVRVLERTVDVP